MKINKQASFTETRGVSQSAVFTELHRVSLPRAVSQVVTVSRDLGTSVPSASRAKSVSRAARAGTRHWGAEESGKTAPRGWTDSNCLEKEREKEEKRKMVPASQSTKTASADWKDAESGCVDCAQKKPKK